MKHGDNIRSSNRSKNCSDEYGFTLIEIMVSLTVLSIILASFLSFFTTSFIHVYSLGRNTNAMARATAQMELLIANSPLTFDEINDILEKNVVDSSTVLDFHVDPVSMNPYLTSIVDGHIVTIVVGYNNSERNVQLTSFIDGGFVMNE